MSEEREQRVKCRRVLCFSPQSVGRSLQPEAEAEDRGLLREVNTALLAADNPKVDILCD